jgi:hypothetical protein
MASEVTCGDTVLTGLLADRSALFGVLAQIEALGLDLVELQEIRGRANPQAAGKPETRGSMSRPDA